MMDLSWSVEWVNKKAADVADGREVPLSRNMLRAEGVVLVPPTYYPNPVHCRANTR